MTIRGTFNTTGVSCTNPVVVNGLASALRKLEMGTRRAPLAPTPQVVNASHMMIANPFRAQDVSRFFATHPPMGDRIARLEAMAGGAQIRR